MMITAAAVRTATHTHSRAVVPQLVMPSRTVFPISRHIPDSPVLLLLMASFQPQALAENSAADSLGHLGQSRTESGIEAVPHKRPRDGKLEPWEKECGRTEASIRLLLAFTGQKADHRAESAIRCLSKMLTLTFRRW